MDRLEQEEARLKLLAQEQKARAKDLEAREAALRQAEEHWAKRRLERWGKVVGLVGLGMKVVGVGVGLFGLRRDGWVKLVLFECSDKNRV